MSVTFQFTYTSLILDVLHPWLDAMPSHRVLAETNWSDVANKFLDKIDSQFGLGTLLGSFLAATFYFMAGRERSARLKADIEREKELRSQLQLKDDRIDKLHQQLETIINKRNKQ